MILKNKNICPDSGEECSTYYACTVLKNRFGHSKCETDENPGLILGVYLEELEDRYIIELNTWSQRKDREVQLSK